MTPGGTPDIVEEPPVPGPGAKYQRRPRLDCPEAAILLLSRYAYWRTMQPARREAAPSFRAVPAAPAESL
jgi:hypothetical protein